jgi:hypothetical protein
MRLCEGIHASEPPHALFPASKPSTTGVRFPSCFHQNAHVNSAAAKAASGRFPRQRKQGELQRRDIFTAEHHEQCAENVTCCDHFRALVNFLEKLIVYVEDYGELALAGDQLIIGPLSFG